MNRSTHVASTLRFVAALLVGASPGCSCETPPGEPGPDGSGGFDAGTEVQPDGGPSGLDAEAIEAGADALALDTAAGCLPVRAGAWRLDFVDDVSVRFAAPIVPEVGGEPFDLFFEPRRYGGALYIGEFPLGGSGRDGNFDTCARCVGGWYHPALPRAYFASEGTLVSRIDPFGQALDITVTGLRLVEVTLEGFVSVPVPGGRCLDVEDFTVQEQGFPSVGWICAPERFADGETCDCGCGAWVPDCYACEVYPPEAGCDPDRPLAGCLGAEDAYMCTYDGACAPRCDHAARFGCTTGVCGISAQVDRCFGLDEGVDSAALGETCAPGNQHCAVDGARFAMGHCDSTHGWLCQPLCFSDADCSDARERCGAVRQYPSVAGYCTSPIECDYTEAIPCLSGVCALEAGVERCFEGAPEVGPAALGEVCELLDTPRGPMRPVHCGVDAAGFARGRCVETEADGWRCNLACRENAECSGERESCWDGVCRSPPDGCTVSGGIPCVAGVCVSDGVRGHRCLDPTMPDAGIDAIATFGEPCAPGALHCAVNGDGLAFGYCGRTTCLPVCGVGLPDCPAGEHCDVAGHCAPT